MFRYLLPRLAGIAAFAGAAILLARWLTGDWPLPDVSRLGTTLQLLLPAAVLMVTVGLLLGFPLTHHRRASGVAEPAFIITAVAAPIVWFGSVMVLGQAGVLAPLPGAALNLGAAGALALPGALVIGVASGRIRGAALVSPWVLTARSQGLTAAQALSGHTLRTLAVPLLWVVGVQLVFLVGGTAAVERAFGIRGLGWQVHAASPEAATALVAAAAAGLLLVLLVRLLIDPRVRHAAA